MSQPENSEVRIPSPSVLALVPERVATFLRGVVLFPAARAALEAGGYRASDHAEGLRLLNAFFEFPSAPAPTFAADQRVAGAQAEVEEWVRTNFTRLSGAVRRVNGARCGLFRDIESPTTPEAVLALRTLLNRIEHADPEDRGGCETLAHRGLDDAERARLAQLVDRARSLSPAVDDPRNRDRRVEELTALYYWHLDWANTARAMIRNRLLLATLGIARRKWRAAAVDAAKSD